MSHKILLADAERADLRLLGRLFRRDYEVLSAASGEDALRLPSRHDVALVITDRRVPGMAGVEPLKRTAGLQVADAVADALDSCELASLDAFAAQRGAGGA